MDICLMASFSGQPG